MVLPLIMEVSLRAETNSRPSRMEQARHGICGAGVACKCLLRALWLALPWRPNLWHLALFPLPYRTPRAAPI
jgi:hypothetical protein